MAGRRASVRRSTGGGADGPRLPRYVALLRGVNNIGSRRVAMADLRALFERLGFREVSTLLNSGNVVFSDPTGGRGDVGARIERALAARLRLSAAVIVLSAAEVVASVRRNPLADVATNPSHLLVIALRAPSERKRLRPLLERRWAPEALALGRRVAWLWCARGVAKSPLWTAVDRALVRTGTARNLATMTKLMAVVRAPSGPGAGTRAPGNLPHPGVTARPRRRRLHGPPCTSIARSCLSSRSV
jgi:uncharacterized protein (DUF1697 family)